MFFVEVDGRLLPQPLAGHPALELCNTWAGWNSPPGAGGDYLRDYPTLATWALHHGLITADERAAALADAEAHSARGDAVLRDTKAFRGHLYSLLVVDGTGAAGAPADGRAALASVSRVAAEAHGARHLERLADGSTGWRFDLGHPVRLPLLTAAASAADLLTSPAATTVHACPGNDCGWLFLDPRGRRKWCSMAVCGNRAKARAHAARQRG